MKVSKNFDIREFVPVKIWDRWGERSIWFVDPTIITVAQLLRDLVAAPVKINDKYSGGQYNFSGFRPPGSIGATLSQHRFGRAIDVKVSGHTAKQVYSLILREEAKFRQAGLTAIEDISATPTWVHLDCRPTGLDNILIVKP